CSSPNNNGPKKGGPLDNETESTRFLTDENDAALQVLEFANSYGPAPSFSELEPSIIESDQIDVLVSADGGIIPALAIPQAASESLPPTSLEHIESAKALLDEGKLPQARLAYTKALHAWDLTASDEAATIA